MSHLTRRPIAVEALIREVAGPERGGTCVFLGTVRDAPQDGGVTAIEYTAYEAMANAEFDHILGEARARWPDCRIAVQHRLGLVETEEASIAIAAAAPHRAQAFDACRFVIDEVKTSVPIWKKELRADGTTQWVDPSGHPSMVGPQ